MFKMLAFSFLFLIYLKCLKITDVYFKLSSKRNIKVSELRKLEKEGIRYAKLKLDLLYFENCQQLGICPKFLQFKLPNIDTISKDKKCLYQRTVSLKIKEIQKVIKKCERDLWKFKNNIKVRLTFLEWGTLTTLINKKVRVIIESVKIRHEKKLTKLWVEQRIKCPESIKNFSKVKLSTIENDALRFGLKHHVLPKNLKINHFKLSIEKGFWFAQRDQNFDNAFKDNLKHTCGSFINAANNVCNSHKNRKLHQTLKNLSKNDKIKIANFDKGNGIVILDSDDYVSKLDKIVSDQSKFTKIIPNSEDFQDDPVVKSENSLIYYLKRYVKPFVSDAVFNNILPCGSQPGKMYGMAKVHKDNCPLRPVVSMLNTAEYNLAKYLDSYIKPNIPSQYMLHSTNQLLSVLEDNKNLANSKNIMISFDVVSLFTNVPLKESIDLAVKYVYSSENKPAFDSKVFERLLQFATGGIFTFCNTYYKQTDGVMMGSPLGPSLSSLFLAHLEKEWMAQKFSPLLYRRYVDDIFCIFSSDANAMDFLDFINVQHPNLKFTYENCKDRSLPFLDVNIFMKDNIFETCIFRKETFTGLLLNFKAMCPVQWKKRFNNWLLT